MSDQRDLWITEVQAAPSHVKFEASAMHAAYIEGGMAMWRDQVLVSLNEDKARAALAELAEAWWPRNAT